MSKSYCWVCSINALSAVTRRSENVKLAVIHIYLNFHILNLRHDCNCDCRGMNSTTWLCSRNSLNSVNSTFKFKPWISSISLYHKAHSLDTTNTDIFNAHCLHTPVLTLCISCIKPVHICCKQSCLVAANARSYLNNYVLVIIRILGQKKNLKAVLKLRNHVLGICKFFLEHFLHIWIWLLIQHHKALFHSFLAFFVLVIALYKWL